MDSTLKGAALFAGMGLLALTAHAATSIPQGTVLESTKGEVKVHAGAGLLLCVDSSGIARA